MSRVVEPASQALTALDVHFFGRTVRWFSMNPLSFLRAVAAKGAVAWHSASLEARSASHAPVVAIASVASSVFAEVFF